MNGTKSENKTDTSKIERDLRDITPNGICGLQVILVLNKLTLKRCFWEKWKKFDSELLSEPRTEH